MSISLATEILRTDSAQPAQRPPISSLGAGPVANQLSRYHQTDTTELGRSRVLPSISGESSSARDFRRFNFKTHVATVAMHLSSEWRASLFKQVDLLLCADEEWDDDEPLPEMTSWETFVRLVIHYRFRQRPSLSVYEGIICATWVNGDTRLTLECLPHDLVRWVGSRSIGEVREAAAGETTLKRLPDFLIPFSAADWLLDAQ